MGVQILAYAGVGLCAATQTGGALLFIALFVGGFSQGIAMPEMINLILGDVPAKDTGLAAGAMNSTLQIGSAISVAGIGSLFFTVLGDGASAAAYGHALGIAMAAICIALVGALLVGLRNQARR
jgi:sugar phosphate permease